jgi:hypothetical protein
MSGRKPHTQEERLYLRISLINPLSEMHDLKQLLEAIPFIAIYKKK